MTDAKNRVSVYPCPHCGEHKLNYPDIKGQYGWFDTTKYICSACNRESPSKTVRELGRAVKNSN